MPCVFGLLTSNGWDAPKDSEGPRPAFFNFFLSFFFFGKNLKADILICSFLFLLVSLLALPIIFLLFLKKVAKKKRNKAIQVVFGFVSQWEAETGNDSVCLPSSFVAACTDQKVPWR